MVFYGLLTTGIPEMNDVTMWFHQFDAFAYFVSKRKLVHSHSNHSWCPLFHPGLQ